MKNIAHRASHLSCCRIYWACCCKTSSTTPTYLKNSMGSSFSFSFSFPVYHLLHSSSSLYLSFSWSLEANSDTEPWARPWLKLPVNDKGPNAAAHANPNLYASAAARTSSLCSFLWHPTTGKAEAAILEQLLRVSCNGGVVPRTRIDVTNPAVLSLLSSRSLYFLHGGVSQFACRKITNLICYNLIQTLLNT